MNPVLEKIKEVLQSVLPVTLLVIILNFTLVPLGDLFPRFLIGAVLVIVGLIIFLLGVDVGITPIGNHIGHDLARRNNLFLIIASGLVLGFLISYAEPDLRILAEQVEAVTADLVSSDIIVIAVSLGIAVMMTLGLLRIVYNFPLNRFLTLTYLAILVLGVFAGPEFLAIAFDASGSTTGALTVPFMLALAAGISALKKGERSEEDTFGLVGIASSGAILGVLVLNRIHPAKELTGSLPPVEVADAPFFIVIRNEIFTLLGEIALSLPPILVIFFIFQFASLHLGRRTIRHILTGSAMTYIGLVLFLTGVNVGFMDSGSAIGLGLAARANKLPLLLIALLLGMVTVLAEPAVAVLTHQIEDMTSGSIRRKTVLMTLSIGVGLALVLAVLRVMIPGFQLWHILLPGYLLGIALSYYVPPIFVGMAFDAGGVASGPMTATFALAFIQGAAQQIPTADLMLDGFGMIALVALAPVVSLQLLGVVYKRKSLKDKEIAAHAD